MTIQIIDDSDVGFAIVSGSWSTVPEPGERGDSARQGPLFFGSPAVASWTFTGVGAVPQRVAATWLGAGNRGHAITFRVYDGDADTGTLVKTRVVNQGPTPSDFTLDGSPWHDLAYFTPASGTITVTIETTMTGAGESGFGIADAVRVSDEDVPDFPRVRGGALQVDPTGNLLFGVAERTSDGGDMTVTGVLDDGSMTLSWDSVSRGPGSITLDSPMFFSADTFFWWRLNKGHIAWIDDADATRAGVGWSTPFEGRNALNNNHSECTSTTGTITYTFTGVVPGTYRLSTTLSRSYSGYASNATYDIYDGAVAGSPAATLTDDQRGPRDGVYDWDDVLDGYFTVRTLGEFACTGTTVNIVVHNPSPGVGTLIADALKIVRRQDGIHSAVPADATNIRWNAPQACVTTGSIEMPAQVDAPVVLTDDDTWMGIDTGLTPTMRLGYNKGHQSQKEQCLWHANLMRSHPAEAWSGPAITDADGRLTGKSGPGNINVLLLESTGDGVTHFNLPSIPRSGTIRMRYTTPDSGHLPTFVRLRDIDSTLIFGDASDPADDPHGDGWKVITQTYTPAEGVDDRYTCALSIETDGVADLQSVTIDEMTPDDWPHDTNAVLYSRLKGYGFHLRHVDSQNIVGARDSTWADRARDSRLSPTTPSVTKTANIVSVSPISDSDPIIQQRFSSSMKSAIVRIEVDSTAGWSSGHGLTFQDLSQSTFADTATSGDPAGATGPGTIDLDGVNIVDVEDGTHFVGRFQGTTSIPDLYPGPYITVAGTTAVTGSCYQETGIGESHESVIRLHNETDSHLWVHMPHAATDDYATQMGTLYGSTLDHGLDVVLELSNEIWNGGGGGVFTAGAYTQELLAKYLYDFGLDSDLPNPTNLYEAVTQRAIELFTAFTDAFETAGGVRANVKWALMGQTHNVGPTIAAAIGYLTSEPSRLGAASEGVPVFHYFGGDAYWENRPDFPGLTNYTQAYATAVLDDLDVSGNVSLCAKHQLHDRMSANMDDMLTNMALLPYPTEIAIYEYSYNHLRYGASIVTVPQSTATVHHPRAFKLRTAWHQQLQRRGVGLAMQYTMDQANGFPPNEWRAFDNIETAVGTGDPGENANPYAVTKVSQIGGADRAWMEALAAGETPASAVTLATAATGTVGVAQVVTVALDGVGTCVVTLTPTGGTLSASTVTFTGEVGPKTVNFTPTAAGTATIAATNDGGLADPADASIDVAAAPATHLALSGPSTGTVGVAATFTVTPDGPYTGTVTPHATGGAALSPSTLSYSSEATAKTFDVTPAAPGTSAITVTASPSLTYPGAHALAVQATAFALAGPTSGISGVASTYTVTPNGPFTGVITPHASGLAGTLSPATLTYTAEATAKVFTFTPSDVGTATISATDDGGLVDPASVTLVVTSGPATSFALDLVVYSGAVGVPVVATVSPNGTFTGTIALAATGGAFVPPTVSFLGSAVPLTAAFTPAQVGTLTLVASSGGALSDPAARYFTATAARPVPATAYTLTGPTLGLVDRAARFTVMPDGTATATVAFDVAGGAGVFSPPTVTFAGAASRSTSFVPADAGPYTLSATNNGGLADPDPLAFVATVPVAGPVDPGALDVPLVGALTMVGTSWAYVPRPGNYEMGLDDDGMLVVASTALPAAALVFTLDAGLYTVNVVRRPDLPPVISVAPFAPAGPKARRVSPPSVAPVPSDEGAPSLLLASGGHLLLASGGRLLLTE